MRPLLVLLLVAAPAFSQLVSFGVKGGVPLTDFVNAASGTNAAGFIDFATHTNRYIIGATGELHLPLHLSVEVDVLFRHFNYDETQGGSTVSTSNTRGNAWEFPLLGKYRFGPKLVHPFVDAGVVFDSLQGLSQTVKSAITSGTALVTNSSGTPSQLVHSTVRGYVFGAGIDIKFLVIHIQPEIRYTRWGAEHFFDPSGLLHSNQNQGEFLLGIEF